MRKALCLLFFLSIGLLFKKETYAQTQVTLKEVAKIRLMDGYDFRDGTYLNEYELLPENDLWKTHQTRTKYLLLKPYKTHAANAKSSITSATHRFIKIVPNDSIRIFLKSLQKIKPRFNAADLKVSIPKLLNRIDSTYLRGYLDEKKQKIFHSFLNTPAKLNRLLDTLQHEYWTADWPFSIIEIVKKAGDTVKILTTSQLDYMLPWRINNTPTYDVNINQFFLTATGIKDHRMNGLYLSRAIYHGVDRLYANDAFERLRWREIAPAHAEYLKQQFKIVKLRAFDKRTDFVLHPRGLPRKILIDGTLNITKKEQLQTLIRYAQDTLKPFLKSGGFMIDSCLAKPGCTITFDYRSYGDAHYHTFFMDEQQEHYLQTFSPSEIHGFAISAGERVQDYWIGLPGKRFILVNYMDDYAVGVQPQYINKDGDRSRKSVFMLFAADGTLITPGSPLFVP